MGIYTYKYIHTYAHADIYGIYIPFHVYVDTCKHYTTAHVNNKDIQATKHKHNQQSAFQPALVVIYKFGAAANVCPSVCLCRYIGRYRGGVCYCCEDVSLCVMCVCVSLPLGVPIVETGTLQPPPH